MFELPEYLTLARQITRTLRGKRVSSGSLGNSPHKFVWYNRSPEEFARITRGKSIGDAYCRGRWLFVALEPGYLLVFGECGGRILYHADEHDAPAAYHLLLRFEDGSALSAMTRMWGAMELYERGKELERQYIKGMRPTPVDEEFTLSYFQKLVAESCEREKRSVKSLLTQEQLVPGLGNAIAQDIMFKAKLNPRRSIAELDAAHLRSLHAAIRATVSEVAKAGGRNDEPDLFGEAGGYVRIMDKNAVGRPCPSCETKIVKIQFLGGACYYCPRCQA